MDGSIGWWLAVVKKLQNFFSSKWAKKPKNQHVFLLFFSINSCVRNKIVYAIKIKKVEFFITFLGLSLPLACYFFTFSKYPLWVEVPFRFLWPRPNIHISLLDAPPPSSSKSAKNCTLSWAKVLMARLTLVKK